MGALLGRALAQAGDVARAASPITHVRAGAPPMLLLHGTADSVVPASHSRRLAAASTRAGAPVRLQLVPDAEHCFDGVDPLPALRSAVAFLADHLRA